MFNQEIKQEYLDSVNIKDSTLDIYKRWFSVLEPFEEKLDKDISCFTSAEVSTTLKDMSNRSVSNLMNLKNFINIYSRWCYLNKKTDAQEHRVAMRYEDVLALTDKEKLEERIISRTELVNLCNRLLNPRDKVLLLGTFEGIKGKTRFQEFLDLTVEDLYGDDKLKVEPVERYDVLKQMLTHVDDLPDVYIKERGRTIETSPLLKKWMIESALTRDYKVYPRGGVRGHYQEMVLKNDGTILRSSVRAKSGLNIRTLSQTFTNLLEYLGIADSVSLISIRDSGMIDFINRHAKEKGMDAYEYLANHGEDVARQYEAKRFRWKEFYDKYKTFLI